MSDTMSDTVTVVYAGESQAVGAGSSIGELRRLFGPVFNIPAGASAVLNGEDAADSDVPEAGDKVAFLATTGSKG